jgi:hypothetical protein
MPFLHELGDTAVWLSAPDGDPTLTAACAGMASRARRARARTIGLVPASDDVAVPAVAVLLARALAEVASAPAAVVDAHSSWAESFPGPGAAQEGSVATVAIARGLSVVAVRAEDAPNPLRRLRTACEAGGAFEHLVVDLTGFDHAGELLEACEALDASVLVARTGRTTRRAVARWLEELSGVPFLGVLLTGI